MNMQMFKKNVYIVISEKNIWSVPNTKYIALPAPTRRKNAWWNIGQMFHSDTILSVDL